MKPTPCLVVIAFLLFAALYAIDRPLYFTVLDAIHEHPRSRPFLDTRFVTAQVQCWSLGVDVYRRNPCDPLGRTLDYSPLWLHLPFLARSDAATPFLGLAVDGIFLVAFCAMPWAVGNVFVAVVTIAAVLSWATIYANERGNTDLLIFAAAVLFARLVVRSVAARSAAYAIVLAAGLLKFYPLTLLALSVRERGRLTWIVGGVSAVVLIAFWIVFRTALGRLGANMADSPFGDMFGARGLAFGLPLLVRHATIRNPSGVYVAIGAIGPELARQGRVLFAVLTTACVCPAVVLGCSAGLRRALDRLGMEERSLLLTGAILSVGCFFGHQNIGYRAILLLLALPGLFDLRLVAPDRAMRGLIRLTILCVVLVLWAGIVTRSRPGWLILQLSWWWITGALIAIATGLLADDVSWWWRRLAPARTGRAAAPASLPRPVVGPHPRS